jgi:hypothetical protein
VSPNHLGLAQHLDQGRAALSCWSQTAAGVFQALVALAEQPKSSPSERFVVQLRSADEVNSFPSRLDQHETPACETIPRSLRGSPLLAGLLH